MKQRDHSVLPLFHSLGHKRVALQALRHPVLNVFSLDSASSQHGGWVGWVREHQVKVMSTLQPQQRHGVRQIEHQNTSPVIVCWSGHCSKQNHGRRFSPPCSNRSPNPCSKRGGFFASRLMCRHHAPCAFDDMLATALPRSARHLRCSPPVSTRSRSKGAVPSSEGRRQDARGPAGKKHSFNCSYRNYDVSPAAQ